MVDVRNPDHYALVVGISRYPQFPPLQGAVKDATLFAAWLQASEGGGLPSKNIEVLLSPPEPERVEPYTGRPDHAMVTKALATKIKLEYAIQNKIPVGKRLYFYFSGHGFGPQFHEVGMLFAGAAPNRLKMSMGLHLYRQFFQIGSFFEEAIYILDCCRDFQIAAPDGPQIDPPPPPPPGLPIKQTKEAVIMAAPWGAKAFEYSDANEDRRGILTDALLAGLNGQPGAYDFLGRITTSSLKAFLEREVPRRATVINQKQPPQTEWVEDIVLATLPQERLPKTRVRIIAPAGMNGTLEVLRGDNTVQDRRATNEAQENGAIWEVDLLRGFVYVVRHAESGLFTRLDLTAIETPNMTFRYPRP
jgi:hypothetical protein